MASNEISNFEPASNNNSYCEGDAVDLEGIIIQDEWQDDDVVLGENSQEFTIGITAKPNSLQFANKNDIAQRRKLSLQSADGDMSPTVTAASDDISGLESLPTPDDFAELDALPTPDEIFTPGDESQSPRQHIGVDLEWDNDTPVLLTDAERNQNTEQSNTVSRTQTSSPNGEMFRMVVIGDKEYKMDFRAIIPYRQVLSHGGYYGEGLNAIVVFSACFLPDTNQTDYEYIMENLFLYVVSTLDLLVAEDYMIVFFNSGCKRRNIPSLAWLKRCYQMIHRRLRKNLKQLLVVHPSWYMRIVIGFFRPFISKKFSRKLKVVSSLKRLQDYISLEAVQVPDAVQVYDNELSSPMKTKSSPAHKVLDT